MIVRTILHVEDDPNDAFLVQHAFEKAGVEAQLRLAADGQQALDYLAGSGPYGDRCAYPMPDLVLLDLKMPKLSGFDVLAWLRGQERFGSLPVIILSSSEHCEDKSYAQKLGATAYEVKSPGFERVVQRVMGCLRTMQAPIWAAQRAQFNLSRTRV
jgi:DNA-binding response OmpR family regulator